MEEEATTTINNTATTSGTVPAANHDGCCGGGDDNDGQDEVCDSISTSDNNSSSTRRLIRFACFAVTFWLVVLFLVYEHEERVLILVLVALCLVLMYLTVSICYMITTTLKSSNDNIRSNNNIDDDDDDDGRSGLLRLRTSAGSAGITRDIEGGDTCFDDGCCSYGDGATFRFSFEDTAHQIRSSSSSSSSFSPTSQQQPRDGTYKVVYTAIAFGKPIRSEGFLQLKFKEDGDDDVTVRRRGSGWVIEGVSLFGGRSSSRTIIHDGYLNSEGQMYWIVPMAAMKNKRPMTASNGVDNDDANTTADTDTAAVMVVYRGVFDFDQCCLTDGEFQSINDGGYNNNNNNDDDDHHYHSGKIISKSSKTKGRIVRLEWVNDKSMTMDHHSTGRGGGDGGSSGVEMIVEMPELRQQQQQQDDTSKTTLV